jgi:CubicO group peptidase (beta-lactamase class C family)
MLRRGGTAEDGTRLLSEKMVRVMATPRVPEEVEMGDERWGLGMRVIVGQGYPHGLPVGCFGWSGAYGTHFFIDPKNGIYAVYIKNLLDGGGAGADTAREFERVIMEAL